MSLPDFPLLTEFVESLSSPSEIVERLQQYLRVDTRHPRPDYSAAVDFLESYVQNHLSGCSTLRLDFSSSDSDPKPMLVVLWKGKGVIPFSGSCPSPSPSSSSCLSDADPSKTVLLSSHMDVVATPASENWISDPMEAQIDASGQIVARGVQDMKSVGMGYLEAVRLLQEDGFSPSRDVRILFTVDEELGSDDGMAKLVQSSLFDEWNVGFSLDEGVVWPEKGRFGIFEAERGSCCVKFVAEGKGGHSSLFVENTAIHRLMKLGEHILHFREGQEKTLELRDETLGDVMTVNINGIHAGVPFRQDSDDVEAFAGNVVPKRAIMVVDLRYPPAVTWERIQRELFDEWASQFDVQYEILYEEEDGCISKQSELFHRMVSVVRRCGFESVIRTFVAATDARFLRRKGVNSFGFTPVDETEITLHDVNEALSVTKYIQMIYVYKQILRDILT